MTKTEGRKSKG